MFFDTHAHYDDERFDNDRDAVLKSLPEAGIGAVVNPGCTADSSRAAIALAERDIFVGEQMGETWFFRPEAPVTREEFLAMAMDVVRPSKPWQPTRRQWPLVKSAWTTIGRKTLPGRSKRK